MSQYTASVPGDGQVREEIKAFFEKFYQVSDSPSAHDEYATFFTKNGVLIMGPNETSGRDCRPQAVVEAPEQGLIRKQRSFKCATACGRR